MAHAGAWYGLNQLQRDSALPRPLPVIEVALLTPPPPQLKKEAPVPPRAEPTPPVQPRVSPQPRPLLQAQAVRERTLEQAAEAPPITPSATPVAETPRAALEPVAEAPRFNADYLNNPPPAYPLAARRRGIEGRVLVHAEVQADGSCSRVELKKSSNFDLLDQAALAAVAKWRFIPAKKGAQTITAWVDVPITFKLEN